MVGENLYTNSRIRGGVIVMHDPRQCTRKVPLNCTFLVYMYNLIVYDFNFDRFDKRSVIKIKKLESYCALEASIIVFVCNTAALFDVS